MKTPLSAPLLVLALALGSSGCIITSDDGDDTSNDDVSHDADDTATEASDGGTTQGEASDGDATTQGEASDGDATTVGADETASETRGASTCLGDSCVCGTGETCELDCEDPTAT
jgi:hypothetical protein